MRLIDADELIKWIDNSVSQYGNTYSNDMLNMWGLFKDYLINNVPTVEYTFEEAFQKTVCEQRLYCPQRPQGEWITHEGYDGDEYYECSVCKDAFVLMEGTPKDNNYNFCPNCGADMRGGKE